MDLSWICAKCVGQGVICYLLWEFTGVMTNGNGQRAASVVLVGMGTDYFGLM